MRNQTFNSSPLCSSNSESTHMEQIFRKQGSLSLIAPWPYREMKDTKYGGNTFMQNNFNWVGSVFERRNRLLLVRFLNEKSLLEHQSTVN